MKFYIRIELENIQPASDHGNPHGVCRGFLCRQPARCIGVRCSCVPPAARAVQVLSVSSRAGVVQQDDLPGVHGALWLPHTGNPHGSGCLVLLRLRPAGIPHGSGCLVLFRFHLCPAGQGLHSKMIRTVPAASCCSGFICVQPGRGCIAR